MRLKFIEFNLRSFLKAVTWRVLVSITNFFGGWLSSGSWKVGLGVVSFALVVNSLMYFLHERIWNVVNWGKALGRPQAPDMSASDSVAIV
jgi:uncharacterized membrane protein